MINYIIRRLFSIIFIFFAVSIIVFLTMHMIPGDPARVMAGMNATEADVRLIREKLGLNRPLYIQYLSYIKGIFQGDLGESIQTGRPVAQSLISRYPATLELAGLSLLLAFPFAVFAGVVAANNSNTFLDSAIMSGAVFGISMPSFWRGLMLMYIFSLTLGWLPASGRGGDLFQLEGLKHLILPVLTLSFGSMAYLTRITRSAMMEVLNKEYVDTARSKGLREQVVIYKHTLRNALISVITMAGMQFGWLLGGAVVIETVFAWPGVGRMLVNAIFARDFPVVQSTILIIAISFTLINLIVDLLYAFLDPRIAYD
mgnify:CR=1 FL=1